MRNTFKNLTASGVVIPGEGVLQSMYVNSTSSGTMILYNNTSESNVANAIGLTDITPAAGFHYLGNIHCTAGIYCDIGGTSLDVTFHIVEAE